MMIRKIIYIFDKRQTINMLILFFIIFIGGFMELLGVSLILPLVTIIMDPNIIYVNKWAILLCDVLKIQTSTAFVLFLLGALILMYILKNLYLIMMYSLQYRFTFHNQRRLSLRLMTCYINQEYEFHLSKNTAELERNIITDVTQFFYTVQNTIQLITESLTCLFLTAYLMTTDFATTLGVVITIGICVLIFYKWFRKSLAVLGNRFRQEQAHMIRWIRQSFDGIKEVKVMNREAYFLDHFDECYRKMVDMQRRQSVLQIIPKPILESISICGILLVMIVRILMGVDLIRFVPVLSVFAIAAFRMLPAFNRITSCMSAIMFYKASINAIYEDIKEVDRLSQGVQNIKRKGNSLQLNKQIEIQDLSFQYPGTDKSILDHATMKIPFHSSVALIGMSGAGKTTMVDIILGLLRPNHGKVLADGIDVFEYLSDWREMLGYIPQVIYLMDDTIRNNITFGIPESRINEDRIWETLQEAQLDEFVKSLDKGLDTVVGERGIRLSGGQCQRIGIARALYSNPRVLILDEATSALDNETETAVMEAIEHLHGSKTIVIIAHRLSTIRNCDLVYEVYNKKIILRNKHDILKQQFQLEEGLC